MRTRVAAWLPLVLLGLVLLALPAAVPAGLKQGLTTAERELWWNGPQGSRIMPYAWFLALEQTGGQIGEHAGPAALFAEAGPMARYGYLPSTVNAVNPDGLPIGFTKERDRPNAAVWVGMTCAACHTGSIAYGGRTVVIDGAGGMADTQAFDRDLSAALTATATDDARFGRFADRLGTPAAERAALRDQVAGMARVRAAVTAMNTPPQRPGPGRFDMRGVVTNALTATALQRPGNARAPDAPVRLPWVWTADGDGAGPDKAGQHAGGVGRAGPLLRDITQALGAYGVVDVARPAVSAAGVDGYAASVTLPQLATLEALLHKVSAPAWPADLLPPVDAVRAGQGAAVFARACAACHAAQGGGALAVPLAQIGTDPAAARAGMARQADTGVLEGRAVAVFAGPVSAGGVSAGGVFAGGVSAGGVFGPRAAAAAIVAHIGLGVAARAPMRLPDPGLPAHRRAVAAEPVRPEGYRAVPLAGVWAGAPYLHNGSVANLRELLTPPMQRAVRFVVGGRDFDPVAVGLPADTAAPGFVLDTALPGNGNGGHAYGTALPEAEKAALIEYLKTL